jgi:hypothetical protein
MPACGKKEQEEKQGLLRLSSSFVLPTVKVFQLRDLYGLETSRLKKSLAH